MDSIRTIQDSKGTITRLLLLLGLSILSVKADTFTVTRTNIAGPGSLPAIIAQANNTPGNNIINFGVLPAPITLSTPLPTITNNVTIIGCAEMPTIISGARTISIFSFVSGTTNVISNIVILDGRTTGGGAAIRNDGTLLLQGCILSNNQAAACGGAISNGGDLTIVSSTLCSNRCLGGFGGAIYNSGKLALAGTTVFGNNVLGGDGECTTYYSSGGGGGGGAGIGGAIFSEIGTLSLNNSTVFANVAGGGKGGDGSRGHTTASGEGAAGGGPGGGLGGLGGLDTNVVGSTGLGVGGGGGGGGEAGRAVGGNGGMLGGGGGGGGGRAAAGGVGNLGGGAGGDGYVQPEFNTYGGQVYSGGAGGGGAGLGAGIFLNTGAANIINCSIVSNSVVGGQGGAAGYISSLYQEGNPGTAGLGIGGGIYNLSGSVRIVNSVVAENRASDSSVDLHGAFITSGCNIFGDNTGATGLSLLDFQKVQGMLGPLQDNGGPTMTCVPLPGSLAIGYGSTLEAPRTDQRGVPRPLNEACDIGAVQTILTQPVSAFSLEHSGFCLTTLFDGTNAFQIQVSTNLTTWITLTNVTHAGVLHLIDPASTNMPRRFYRTTVN
jgi:hypothetical protein